MDHTFKILVVEDEVQVAKLFEFNLKKEGFDVKIAVHGAQALEYLQNNRCDLILSDIMMPVMDGYDFRKILLQQPSLKNIPFVYLTAKGSDEDIIMGYDLDIDDYIIKTSPPRIVIAKLKAILKARQKRREEAVDELSKAANSVGNKVLPEEIPSLNNFEVSHWHQPFENTPGGDFLDYIQLDNDNLAVILGDVMGKKWNAWYFALAYAGYVRSTVRAILENRKNFSPSGILQSINKAVYNDEQISEVFTTLSVVILNAADKTACYSGAGDLPLIYKDSESNSIKTIKTDGLLLGFAEDGEYTDIKIDMKPEDYIFLLTDGIVEAENSDGDFFHIDRFKNRAANFHQNGSFCDYIKDEISKYTNGKFSDDISLISIKGL